MILSSGIATKEIKRRITDTTLTGEQSRKREDVSMSFRLSARFNCNERVCGNESKSFLWWSACRWDPTDI
jgi:hypothetical protein